MFNESHQPLAWRPAPEGGDKGLPAEELVKARDDVRIEPLGERH
jgi:hypothetical protein